MPDKPPMIETRGLTKVFRDFWLRPRVTAVRGLDMTVHPHEVFGLLGPNGSGKSTTIKMILGLLFPTKGKLQVMGKLPTDVATKKRIGYLPEESYLYRFLNARETLDYYGRIFGLERHKRAQRIDMLLEMVGLTAVQRRPVGEYSKGMQRRIGLAQALINDPDLLILDEPTTGLDPIGTRQIKDLILQLKDRGKTVLLSSHLLADVEDVCDRVTILYGGSKQAEGTCEQLLTDSQTTVIETDALSDETVAEIERVIEARESKAIRSVAKPRQKLEQLFLDIVHKAQEAGKESHGARAGGATAEFLTRDAHMPEDVDGAALISKLTSAEEPEPEAAAPAEPQPTEPAQERAVLDSLTSVEPDASEAASSGDPKKKKAAPESDEADANVLDDLLGGGD